jgi:hypothetical protein
MQEVSDDSCGKGAPADNRCTALGDLRLTEEELKAVRTQGYLVADRSRAAAVTYWKLRFRFGGRLRSIYLGSDTVRLERVRAELVARQEAKESRRELARLERYGREKLRESKALLKPVLATAGCHYHGDVVRKRRCSTGSVHI